MPRHSRHVGQGEGSILSNYHTLHLLKFLRPALKFLTQDTTPPVPWYRVVSSSGTISSRGPGTSGAQNQRDELAAEGVEVSTGRTGEMRIDFGRWGWFPQVGTVDLPDGLNLAESGPDQEENAE